MAEWSAAFKELTGKTHTQQAIWWLNGYWNEAYAYAETVWDAVHVMIEIETGKPKIYGKKVADVKEGSDLDEVQAHIFMEKLGETMTVVALRKILKELDLDMNRRLSLSEYLLGKHKKNPSELVEASQGGQAEAALLTAAQDAVDKAASALDEAITDAQVATEASDKATWRWKASETAAAELAAAVAELEAQEKLIAEKKAKFQALIADENLSSMKRNKASAELAQLEAEDPMPLQKAKITQKAALKKAEKTKAMAEADEKIATAAKETAEAAKVEADKALEAANEALKELKEKGDGIAHGAVWWMERGLAERQKYMPKKKA